MTQALEMTFITAFLLSGNARRAGDSVSKSIGRQCRPLSNRDPILQDQSKPLNEMALTFPAELRRALSLPGTLRHCFVLRILLSWPRNACARLLHLGIDEIDECTSLATQALLRIADKERES